MTGLQSLDFAYAFKELYLGPLNDQMYHKHVFLNRVEKSAEHIDESGLFAYVPLISARNPGVGSRKDPTTTGTLGPKLPGAGRQSYKAATYVMGLHYGRGAVSGSAKRRSENKAGAFAKAIETEIKGLMESLPDELNRQACGMGNGRAATLAGTAQATSTAIEVDSRDPFTAKVGDRVHFADITAGTGITPANGTTISSINFNQDSAAATSTTKHTVILAAASGTSLTTADDAMYFGAETSMGAADSSRGQEMYGLQALIDDGNIGADLQVAGEAGEILTGIAGSRSADETAAVTKVGGITRSSNPFWQSKVMHNPDSAGTKRANNQTLLIESWLHATAMNGANPSEVEGYCGVAQWGTIGMIQVGGRVYNDFRKTVEFGFEAIEVNGSLVFYDRDLPDDALFWVSMKDIMFLTRGGYELLDDDGSVIRMVAGGGYDAWEFTINRDCQLGASKLRTHVKLKDLTSTMDLLTQLH